MQIAVVGGGVCSPEIGETAERLGRLLAKKGHILICGGLEGVMEAVCRGAREAGGVTLGILPGEKRDANPYVSIAVATGMGHARNVIIVKRRRRTPLQAGGASKAPPHEGGTRLI